MSTTKYPGRYCRECDDVYDESIKICPHHKIEMSEIPDDFYDRHPECLAIAELLHGQGKVTISEDMDSLRSISLKAINEEYLRASLKFPKFNSAHEGYAVLEEEVDELWDAIKKNDLRHAREEAVQVGAMALRFLIDVRGETGE